MPTQGYWPPPAYWAGGPLGPSFWPGAGGAAPVTAISAEFKRERYYGALWSLLTGLKLGGLVKTASRRVRLLEEMESATLPAMFMGVGPKQKMRQSLNQPPVHSLWALVYLYVENPTPYVSADIALNGLLDAVQAALKPGPGRATQTLGETVYAVWMGGQNGAEDIEIFSGAKGLRAAAIVPIEIIIPQ